MTPSKKPNGVSETVWNLIMEPEDRFFFHLGFSLCPDGRFHADWQRFVPPVDGVWPWRRPNTAGE